MKIALVILGGVLQEVLSDGIGSVEIALVDHDNEETSLQHIAIDPVRVKAIFDDAEDQGQDRESYSDNQDRKTYRRW